MNIGIIGLPNTGKSTIFNALTSGHAMIAEYPFTTINPNVGIIAIPDRRVKRLAEIYKPQKATYAHIQFVDIAGLVKGASKGEGLGNQFLGHIKDVDALVHVVRIFDDKNVTHTMGSLDPDRDIEIIATELLLADLQSVEKQITDITPMAKSGEKKAQEKLLVLRELKKSLEQGIPARQLTLPHEIIAPFFLLTAKPMLYVCNVGETSAGTVLVDTIHTRSQKEKTEDVVISGKLESEIAALPDAERDVFRTEMGIDETGLEKLIKKSFALLKLITFFTGRSVEVRAWTVPQGTKAPQAAGKIHTDMEKGFIKAEIFSFDQIDAHGSEAALREKGLIRLEGKDYIVQEGDVAFFRFSA